MTPAETPQKAGRREWIGLAVIALPCLLYSMDLTVLNLALPAISEDLRPSSSELLWIVDIYGFLVAGLLITMGTLGDRIGRRRLLLIGAASFGAASVLAAFASSAPDADRRPRAARRRRRDARALDDGADLQHVRRPRRAQDRDRGLDRQLLRRRGRRPARRRRAARAVLVGLGVPDRRAGDGAAARARPAAAAGVARPGRRPARPRERGALARRGAGGDLRAQAARRGRPPLAALPRRRRRRRPGRAVRAPPAPARGSAARPRPVPDPRLQRRPGHQRARVLRRLRAVRLHRPVPAARARLLAARGGAVVAPVGVRLHRRRDARRSGARRRSAPPTSSAAAWGSRRRASR